MSSKLTLCLALVFVYGITLCPTVYVGDSGELTAAAHSLGIPHNSGYPLYAMIGKLFSLVPLGNVAFRLNLMSSAFAVLTVGLVCRLLQRLTGVMVAALAGAILLGVSPLFWGQTASAEVYTFHTFFVALLLSLMEWWDRDRCLFRLILFAVVAGLSFGNHLQTVMLAPAVLFFILSGGRRAFPETRRLLWPVLLFLLPLLVYAYLPVRTEAGAAIHWGDPNSLGRFLAHVTAATHREGFVLTLTPGASLDRLARTLVLVWDQFGPFLLLGFWGTAVSPRRWSGSLALVILFDLLYTVFLNTASLRVTAFMLPGCVALSILIGVGVADLLTRAASAPQVGAAVRKGMAGACLLIPIVLGAARLDACSQGRNYIAYEYALNMVRTCPLGGTLILEGDNHLFPLVYGRIVERMAEGMTLYDRHDVVFRMPYLGDDVRVFHGTWPELRSVLESRIIRAKLSSGVYYAVFDPGRIPLLEGCAVIHCGLLYRVVDERHPPRLPCDVWRLYASESFHEPMSMDFMSRQLKAHYLFHRGTDLLRSGEEAAGSAFLNRASQIASTGIGTPILDLIEGLRAENAHGK